MQIQKPASWKRREISWQKDSIALFVVLFLVDAHVLVSEVFNFVVCLLIDVSGIKEWIAPERTGKANFTLQQISDFCMVVALCYNFGLEGVSKVKQLVCL